MTDQRKRKFEGTYGQRALTPDELEVYEAVGDIDLSDLGIDHDRQQGRQQEMPPIAQQSRSQWATKSRSQKRRSPWLTDPNGRSPLYFNPGAYAEFTDDKGTIYKDPNIFPPNRQSDLPVQFAPEPFRWKENDTTPQDIQLAALDAFRTNPYPQPQRSFASISPIYPSPPERYAPADAANQSVVSSIGDWLGSMGKGGKTRKKKRVVKRKTIRKMKSKKSKKAKKAKKSRRR
jgi:hypothetical protein